MALLVCLSGKIASGKTSVSHRLADELGWSRVSFGDYVRAQVSSLGQDPNDRQTLQNYGQGLVDSDPDLFCKQVLAFAKHRPGNNLLVDGIRHVSIFNHLQALASPDRAKLIFLTVPEEARTCRAASRGESAKALTASEKHMVEAELADAIPAAADLIVDASLPIEVVTRECLSEIEAWLDE